MFGQEGGPPPGSPPRTVTGQVGGKSIQIDYFAPSMRGRKIYGSLVPYGKVWCPGANWATTVKSESAGIQIGAMKLPPGEYALWVLPTAEDWTLIVNSNAKAFHLDYKASTDLGRTKMALKHLDAPVEQMRWEVRGGEGKQGSLALVWEQTEASIGISLLE
jgi:hypothetical protein